METTEAEVFEALGIGENGQAVAEPAQPQADTAGEREQEVAEPAKTQGEKDPQTLEQRRENAAKRRRAETQAAVDRAVEAALTAERQKREAPLTPEGLQEAIGSHPAVKAAQALLERQDARETAQARERITQELQQIHALDESITTLEDLFSAPYGRQLYEMTQRGYSLADAHYLLNREKLEQARAEKARRAAEQTARGKDHLGSALTKGGRGLGASAVPRGQLELFRMFNPGASDAEIQEYYNKNQKN